MDHVETRRARFMAGVVLLAACACLPAGRSVADDAETQPPPQKLGETKGICAVLGLAKAGDPGSVIRLAEGGEMLLYVQSDKPEEVKAVRAAAESAGLLGKRVYADCGSWGRIHLADNLADAVLVGPAALGEKGVPEKEILRVLRPGGTARLGGRELTKPAPEGLDSWSHPYHGPDNNTQSTDQLARAPYLTQFIAEPKFSPMPEVTVAAGGRVFRAHGHLAHRANQNAVLNTLFAINGYNGTILWKRPLKEGFMIHRNTFIATPETLYLADDESCKLLDAATGKVTGEIVVPEGISDGPVWKWMALNGGILYALVGGEEVNVGVRRSRSAGMGHWPWGMWKGHDYRNPKTNFGYGRTLVAINPATKKVLWTHREEEDYIDSRGVCMKNGRIYFYSDQKFLGCLDAKGGEVLWKASAPELLKAIGPHGRAQHYVTGYSTQTYIKCNDQYVFFAGPHRRNLLAVRAKDGKLTWQKRDGNYLLVLRDDGLYAIGSEKHRRSYKLDYDTGKAVAQFIGRRACTRATGTVDSILYRASGGTVRLDLIAGVARHIAPFRPPCQDGVIVSCGHLYFGPWMCGCALSLYGHIALAPAGEFDFRPGADASRLEAGEGAPAVAKAAPPDPGDWPCYRHDNHRTSITKVATPRKVVLKWTHRPASPGRATAPTAAGGLVFVGYRSGAVCALDAADGKPRWKAYTGGAVFFPPAVWNGRVYVGSADGWAYAFEASTGRRLWRFRVAPAERRIPIFGKLISTWPVAGGVLVEDGTLYAAAGIAHYDGTHVCALDAITGKLKWYNDTSGQINPKTHSGISLQGELLLSRGKLSFHGGNAYGPAYYAPKTGKCLNPPNKHVRGVTATAFDPYYPAYGGYAPLKHTLADGRTLRYDVGYEGSRRSGPKLFDPVPPGERPPRRPKPKWGAGNRWDCRSFIVAPDALIVAGRIQLKQEMAEGLAALDLKDGSQLWAQKLPATPVKWGTAVDRRGRILVSLTDGQILCLAAASQAGKD